jgi:hypothetical protein
VSASLGACPRLAIPDSRGRVRAFLARRLRKAVRTMHRRSCRTSRLRRPTGEGISSVRSTIAGREPPGGKDERESFFAYQSVEPGYFPDPWRFRYSRGRRVWAGRRSVGDEACSCER